MTTQNKYNVPQRRIEELADGIVWMNSVTSEEVSEMAREIRYRRQQMELSR